MRQKMVEHMSMKAWMVGASVAVMVAALVACESNATNPEGAKPAGGSTDVLTH